MKNNNKTENIELCKKVWVLLESIASTEKIKKVLSISVLKTINDDLITKPLIIIDKGIPHLHDSVKMLGCSVQADGGSNYRNFFIIGSTVEDNCFVALYPGQKEKDPPAVILVSRLNLSKYKEEKYYNKKTNK